MNLHKHDATNDSGQNISELQDYIENASIAMHWVDGNGIIKWANQAELQMLGYNRDEYIGHHITNFHVDQPTIENIWKRLNNNEIIDGQESILLCKDGSHKNVQITSSVYRESVLGIDNIIFISIPSDKQTLIAKSFF